MERERVRESERECVEDENFLSRGVFGNSESRWLGKHVT